MIYKMTLLPLPRGSERDSLSVPQYFFFFFSNHFHGFMAIGLENSPSFLVTIMFPL